MRVETPRALSFFVSDCDLSLLSADDSLGRVEEPNLVREGLPDRVPANLARKVPMGPGASRDLRAELCLRDRPLRPEIELYAANDHIGSSGVAKVPLDPVGMVNGYVLRVNPREEFPSIRLHGDSDGYRTDLQQRIDLLVPGSPIRRSWRGGGSISSRSPLRNRHIG